MTAETPRDPGFDEAVQRVIEAFVDAGWQPWPSLVEAAARAARADYADVQAKAVDAANVEVCVELRRIWTDPKDREVIDTAEELLCQHAAAIREGGK